AMKSFGGRAFGAMTLGVAALALLVVGSAACGRGEIEQGLSGPVPSDPQELIAELQTEKEKIDRTSEEMVKRIEAFNATRGPSDRKIQFSELFYTDLSPEQRDVLEQLLQEEKSPSYKNLLSRIIEDRDNIRQLQEQVARLEQKLDDKFVIAQRGDSHFQLAQEYLRAQGISDDQSRDLLNQIDLSEDLLPGFKVWYNYDAEKGTFKTYVTQGDAGQTPLAVKRAVKRKLIGERDVAMAKAAALEQTRSQLEGDIAELETDIAGLQDRRSSLEVQVADLEARNGQLQMHGEQLSSDLEFRQNSLFYHADNASTLAQQGVLTRFLKNLKDVKGVAFDDALDLRTATSISFSPAAYGLRTIDGLEVWPEIYKEGRDYSVQVSEDGGAATLVIQDPHIFRQQRVLIAVRGDAS
ncbi:MAG TPA: hypothetical protein VFP98_06265, partial [Candidatus Polarisedimenticolia bacterium]|nr:hypothetical protein [Candidatus Polarisedimenticolia bacterium]